MKKIIIIVLTAFIATQAFALSPVRSSEREYAIKSGFIYNFARYSTGEWFDPETSDFYKICSNDAAFIAAARNTLSKQTVKGKPVVITLIDHAQTGCHSLFVLNDDDHNKVLIDSAEFHNTMIIVESRNFKENLGHINLFKTGGKIRFEIAPNRLKEANIVLSSKVMRMGRVIDTPRDAL